MKATTPVRVNTEIIDKIKTYSEIESKSQTDFMTQLLTDALDNYFLLRSGGMVLTIPNPQNFIIDENKAKAVLDILGTAAGSICKLNSNIPIPLYAILAFLEQRLFYELPEDVEKFKTNMILDGTQSDEIAEHKNSVGKE